MKLSHFNHCFHLARITLMDAPPFWYVIYSNISWACGVLNGEWLVHSSNASIVQCEAEHFVLDGAFHIVSTSVTPICLNNFIVNLLTCQNIALLFLRISSLVTTQYHSHDIIRNYTSINYDSIDDRCLTTSSTLSTSLHLPLLLTLWALPIWCVPRKNPNGKPQTFSK